MPSRQQYVKHVFGGGWATAFGPNAAVGMREGMVEVPFLVNAENVEYMLDGGPRKAGGSAKLHAGELESGATVKGLYDAWFSGTGGSSTQHRIIHVGTKIKRDDADGSFSDLFTGLVAGAVPAYSMMNDILIMSSDSTADVPRSWDGSTAQNLAGTPPNFAFSAVHKNRTWAAGNASKPSRLYFSVLLDSEDWTGSGSGEIDIDPDDGDRITGIVSHKNDLWVFKGPYKGSIHRITGSAPTGDDAFARIPFVKGVGAAAHNTIFRFRDDIGFMWSDGSIHSLKTTAAFGDYNEVSLTRPIQTWIDEHVNFSRLAHAWATSIGDRGLMFLTLAVDGSTDNNALLVMDYRFEPVRWAYWPDYDLACVAEVVDPARSNQRTLMGGGNDGFVRKLGQPTRSIDGDTAIAMRVTSPFMDYGTPMYEKELAGASMAIASKNDGEITFGWQGEGSNQQTTGFSQTDGDVLGDADVNEFVLDTSTLGGTRLKEVFQDLPEGGLFRALQWEISQASNNEDAEVHTVGLILGGSLAMSTEN